MSAISSVNSGYQQYNNYNSHLSEGNFASGKKIQKAGDGASELAIIQKMERQERGIDAGSQNMQSAMQMLNISDGALGQVTDSLQRMNELAMRATSPFMTDDDKAMIQTEIDQLKQGISDIADQTNYNGIKLLDGSNQEFDIAVNSDGASIKTSTANSTLEALGIADFSVMGKFDTSVIGNALKTVSANRSTGGAQTNALEHYYNYSRNSSYNTTSAKSSLEDLDYPKGISEMKKRQLLQEYQLNLQKRRMEEKRNQMGMTFM